MQEDFLIDPFKETVSPRDSRRSPMMKSEFEFYIDSMTYQEPYLNKNLHNNQNNLQ